MIPISLDLSTNIIYVAGYVNDVVTIFQQDSLNIGRWKADVAASENDLYHIVLEMHDEVGNVGYYDEVVEYIPPTFVYDRAQEDVDRVYELRRIGWRNMTQEQRKEWLGGLKGCLNTSDLKRIENTAYIIAQLLKVEIQSNKDNLPEIPDGLYFQTLLSNVSKLRKTGYIHGDTPKVPVQPLNTYRKINDIEHILHDIYHVYIANSRRFPHCGNEIYAGEGDMLL